MAFKRINQIYFLADSKEDLKDIPAKKMGTECFVIEEACEYKQKSNGEWVKQSPAATTSNNDSAAPDLSIYATKDELNQALTDAKVNTTFGESADIMASNPGSAFGIALNNGDTRTLPEVMLEKGIGLYTFWVHKSNEDLPAEVKEKNSSCRGLCCVDTVKETGWYGWIQLFDHDGYMYTRYIRNSVPTEWHMC